MELCVFGFISENGCLPGSNYCESELSFLYEDIKICRNHLSNFLKRSHADYRREPLIGRLKKAEGYNLLGATKSESVMVAYTQEKDQKRHKPTGISTAT
jgi:hypothetical protein